MKRLLSITVCLALALALTCPAQAGEDAAEEDAVLIEEEAAEGERIEEIEEPVEPEEPSAVEPEAPPAAEGDTEDGPVKEPETPPAGEEAPPSAAEDSAEEPEPSEPPQSEDGERPSNPVIEVEAPTNAMVVVNPYRMKVQLDGMETTDAIVGRNEVLRNYSGFPIAVEAVAAGNVPENSEAVFAAAPPDRSTREKAVYMYVEFRKAASEGDAPDWSGKFTDTGNQILVNGAGKKEVLILDAGTASGPGYGMLRLFGETAASPAKPWSAADLVEVTVSFSFTPAAGTAGTGEQTAWSGPAAEPEQAAALESAAEPGQVSEPEPAAGPEPEVPPEEAPEWLPELELLEEAPEWLVESDV